MNKYGDVVVYYGCVDWANLIASRKVIFRGPLLDAIKHVLKYDQESLISNGRSKHYSFADEYGLAVPENVIQRIAISQQTAYYICHRQDDTAIATDLYYRQMPVPRTGKRVWRGYYRSPKTFQERKELARAAEFGVKVRGRRRVLPTNYDDIPHGDIRINNWKRYRNTQYKT